MNNLGLNVVGYIDAEFGLGEAVRLNIKALSKVGIPTSLINYSVKTPHSHSNNTFTDFSNGFKYDINLIQVSPAEVPNLLKSREAIGLKGKYNILFVAWESEIFPIEYIENISFFDEIWVPSKFCQESLSKNAKVPVINIPHPIEITLESTNDSDAINFFDKTKFNYLFVFDYNSSLERKNTINLIKAFKNCYSANDENVMLSIKTSKSNRFVEEKNQLLNEIGIWKNIKIIEKIFDKNSLNTIISNCDCYVSLHRSEGFGLTMAEAMYFGKPVIATGYSGNLEFMDFQNSLLVNYDLTTNFSSDINYEKGVIWANPDINHASHLIKKVFENKIIRDRIGVSGKKTVDTKLSFEKIGWLMKNRLEFINQFMLNSNSHNDDLIKLKIQNEKLVEELKIIKKSKIIRFILDVKYYFRKRKKKKSN